MLTAMMILASWVMMYFVLRQMVKRMYVELRREFREQMDPLSAKVAVLDRMVPAQSAAALAASPVQKGTMERLEAQAVAPLPSQAPATKPPEPDETPADIPAEVLAAVQPFLGQKIRIRSAKLVQNPYTMVKAWAREGRAGIQTSHNFSQLGRH